MSRRVYEQEVECKEVRLRPQVFAAGPRYFEVTFDKHTVVTPEPAVVGKKYRIIIEEVE